MSIIVCHACDLVHRRSENVPERTCIRCTRCHAELYRTRSSSMDTAIAVAVSALVLFLLSNFYPLVTLQLNGSMRDTTLVGATVDLYLQGYAPVAALVLLTAVVTPLFQIAALLYLLVSLRMNRRSVPGRNELFRALAHLQPWAMSEVFMLGALVAMVKLSAMAEVIPGVALFAYGALMLMLSALTYLTPAAQFWQWVKEGRA